MSRRKHGSTIAGSFCNDASSRFHAHSEVYANLLEFDRFLGEYVELIQMLVFVICTTIIEAEFLKSEYEPSVEICP